MLPGFSGHLLSESFLEHCLAGTGNAAAWPPAAESGDRRVRALAGWLRTTRTLGPASSLRAVLEVGAAPLAQVLDFGAVSGIEVGAESAAATLGDVEPRIALVVAPWGERLEPLWRLAVLAAIARRARWSFLFNGTHLRVVDGLCSHSGRHAEFELDAIVEDGRAFESFWRVCSAGAITALDQLVVASDRHGAAVCRSLRDGVLEASECLVRALVAHSKQPGGVLDQAFDQALTIVYRLLFLLFAEARALVPVWHPVYRGSYSVESLLATVERSGTHRGLWDALRALARLAHAGCHVGDLRVTPFNGRLFAPRRTPLAERRHLDDGAAGQAVLALTTRPTTAGRGRERIGYRDLGVEQLGAVYERLLDYRPRVDADGVRLSSGAGIRKATGTFYTPQPIAEYLVRQTLAPLVRDATPEQILQLRIVDPAMGSGAFLVAACRYLASAYEAALVAAGGCHASDFGEAERALIRRMVAERCLYGVDLNPMAVQLARLSLWLATLAANRPLSFLDHRLLVGDSLLGTWLSLVRDGPRARRESTPATLPLFDEDMMREAVLDAMPIRVALESTPNDTLDQVRAKERMLASAGAGGRPLSKWKRVADLWCACWFADAARIPASAFGALADAIFNGRGALPAHTTNAYLREAERLAEERCFFQWEAEFPEVFFDSSGAQRERPGFDAVIGNPPWEMLRADAGAADERQGARRRNHAVLRFTRDAGIYRAQSDGHANRYQLFVERAVMLTRSGGRIGLVLPSGLALDRGSAPLRRMLLARCDVDALVGFDNRRGVFPIHRSVGFLLVTATAGTATETIACRHGVEDPSSLASIGDDVAQTPASAPVRLSPGLLEKLSGEDMTIPRIANEMDLAIAERTATLFLPLGDARGWSARFGRELNATDDRHVFRAAGRGLPVVEGKQIEPFRVDLSAVRHAVGRRDVERLLPDGRCTRMRLAYRDVSGATNRVTLIAALLPGDCVSTHTVFCLRTRLSRLDQYFLCGLFNSYVVNFLVRQRVTTHVTTAIVERLPIPLRREAPAAYREIAAYARILARRHDSDIAARLHARVAELYQLSREEFAHILSTFPLIPEEERRRASERF